MIENISVKVDDVGRVVIPKKVRKELNINIDDILLLSVKNNKIEMEKRENNDKLELLIRKLELLIKDYKIDIVLTNNSKVVFTNIEGLEDQKVHNNIKKTEINKFMKSDKTLLTNDYSINTSHYYCSFYLNVYTKYNLFLIYKRSNDEKIVKAICEFLLI